MKKKPLIKCVSCKYYNADNLKVTFKKDKPAFKKCIRENIVAKGQNCINFTKRGGGTRKIKSYSYW